MDSYLYKPKDLKSWLNEIYANGLGRSGLLDDEQIERVCARIGLFRLKGYFYAFKGNLGGYTIDDLLQVYFFDKFLTRQVMELTSTIEGLLKTRLIEVCYALSDNPFFYLCKESHKKGRFYLNEPAKNSWRALPSVPIDKEVYTHYILYYKSKYSFDETARSYLQACETIELEDDINYPPFHYLIESATLGLVIHFVKSLQINQKDILKEVGRDFGITSPKTFGPYLDRLNEVRNRAAHRERLFNRSYRSVKGVGRFKTLRERGSEHRLIDVYLYLYFLLGWLDEYEDQSDFYRKEIVPLLDEYMNDRIITKESYGINKRLDEKMKRFIARGIGKKLHVTQT